MKCSAHHSFDKIQIGTGERTKQGIAVCIRRRIVFVYLAWSLVDIAKPTSHCTDARASNVQLHRVPVLTESKRLQTRHASIIDLSFQIDGGRTSVATVNSMTHTVLKCIDDVFNVRVFVV
jgi:hypothetical protein